MYFSLLPFVVPLLLLDSLQDLGGNRIVSSVNSIFHILLVQWIVDVVRLFVSKADTPPSVLPIGATRTTCATATSIEGTQLGKVALVEGLLSRQANQLRIGLRLSVGEFSCSSLHIKFR